MGLFRKKEEQEKTCCSVSFNGTHRKPDTVSESVKVLGSGCQKCHALEANVKTALQELGMSDEVEHVTDFAEIAAYGVMSTPALVVDGRVASFGKVLTVEEIKRILEKVR